jgi:hypothetical protein
MKVKTLVWLLVELAVDLVRGKLEEKREPVRPLPRADAERQSRFAREAGKHGVVPRKPN